ncbi:MAG: photosynthetic reaction center cytochrome c subunit [Acetobacteraceae bacterium]|nr:photosynthetic reaction center cytochrome c subunit [Acetobacteraceae bacterium]
MNRFNLWFGLSVATVLAAGFFILTFERPPVETVQSGYRGVALEQNYNPRQLNRLVAAQRVPEALEAADAEGPRASEIYENVRVLGHLSVEQFGRIMQAMTAWIYPEDERDPENTGCNACHVGGNFAAEGNYRKTVARRMLQMVQTINTTYANHIQDVGVTCYTCHRGQAVPAQVWAQRPANAEGSRNWQVAGEQNRPIAATAYSTLPSDPFTPYLLRNEQIRVISNTARQTDSDRSIAQTEWTYSLMMHFSQSLGVNCTFCHNSRSFAVWETSPPQRVTAWHGINMVRAINNEYIEPLRGEFPPHRLGPMGDTLKVNCATCHQGVYQPLFGTPMLRDYPELNPPPRRASLD